MPQTRPALAAYLLIVFFLSSFFSHTAFSHLTPQKPPQVLSATVESPLPEFVPPIPVDDTQINILLLGHGDAGHSGGHLTDAITLAHFDTQRQLLALISIPRDLWLTFPDLQPRKVNVAFSQDPKTGSIAKTTVSSLTGLPIDHFVAVNFFGLTAIVDELKGISITLDRPLHDAFYPVRGRELELCDHTPQEVTQLSNTLSGFELEKQFPCRYETLNYSAGRHTITGAEALKISRSRHGSSDFDRSSRQQAILMGIMDKLISLDALAHAPVIYKQFQHTFSSDIDHSLAAPIASAVAGLPDYRIVTINLSTDNVLQTSKSSAGAFILTPKSDLASVHAYIQSQLQL